MSTILQAFLLTQVVEGCTVCTHTVPSRKESMIDLALVSSEARASYKL